MNINRVMLTGNLTRDGELRVARTGTQVLTFGAAVNDRRRNAQTGEWEDYPNFFDCTLFGPRAEALRPYLLKGVKVAVEGRLRYSSWEKDGERRSRVTVIVDELEFMSRNGQPATAQTQAPALADAAPYVPARGIPAPAADPAIQAPALSEEAALDLYDEDIPF